MDLSDGLSLDLHRLALASGLEAAIQAPPRFPGATPDQALHGGEDYELLFTVRPRADVPPQFEGLPLTRIGVMRRGQPGAVYLAGELLAPLGYDHFRNTVCGVDPLARTMVRAGPPGPAPLPDLP